jgi:Tol biopolymer transport system component
MRQDMMKRLLLLMIALTISAASVLAQNSTFGKNKVQYKHYEWQFIQTDHFDIYYAQTGFDIAQFTAHAAESAYNSIKQLFRYDINNRIPIVVYNSHNEFQQTNVISEYMEEGIGGVTESFKNRVVIPFEGNYAMFRHVIHHELVHAVLNDMLGGTVQALISSRAPIELPMWMNEGIAEYASQKWETDSDMFLRDATDHNYLPPINYLEGYFAYRGGQSVWYYIANKYGEQKIGEIFNRIKTMRSVDRGLKAALGMDIKELSERWQKEEKTLYWPDVAKREEPADFAFKRLTKHTKDGNFYNTSPALSPQGDKVAFLSDRDDYFDVFLMSASDGEIIKKLVSGQRTKNFEELHLLTPGITWSPDGKKIALAVKAGEHDAIMIVDVETKDVQEIAFDLDGIFSVNWSPNGDMLTFVGMKVPQSDIYIYNLKTKELQNLTNDLFTDHDPVFASDNKTIYFSSDRRNFVSPALLDPHFKIWQYDYGQLDIYSIDIITKEIKRVTDFPNSNETSPAVSPDGKKLLFVSDRNGINNIYVKELESGNTYPITNSLSGLYQLSLSHDGSKLVFASLNEGGFDLYLMVRPFERKLSVTELEPTEFIKRKFNLPRSEKPHEILSSAASLSDTLTTKDSIIVIADTVGVEMNYRSSSRPDLSGYVFASGAWHDTTNAPPPITQTELLNNQDNEGNYIPRRYKLNFTPDIVYGTTNYNTFYGLEGSTIFAFSDMLGDHQIILGTNLMIDLKDSDYGLTYLYLPNRIDYGFQGFHSARFLYMYDTLYRYQTWAVGGIASYPMDRYNRIDFSLMWMNLSRDNLDNSSSVSQERSFLLPSISYVNDNTIWQGAWFAPNNGSRFNFLFYGTPNLGDHGMDMQTFTADYRSYNKVLRDLIFAYRLSGGISIGANRQYFFIGGTEGWLNRRFVNNEIPINNVEDYQFLTPVLPLRGYDYNTENGTKFAVVNAEWRFPLLKYLIFGALPIGFSDILGTAFLDIGSAWSNNDAWKGFGRDSSGSIVTQDLLVGTGLGIRMALFGLPMRLDIAWRFNYASFSEPYYYYSLGADF